MNTIYLFHDRGVGPETLQKLEEILRNALPDTNYVAPYLPHTHTGISAEDSYNRVNSKFRFPVGSVIIGVGLGGLIAAKIQETARPDLKIVAIAAPTQEDKVILEKKIPGRLALYSTKDDLIKPNTNWELFSFEAHDYTPLMFHNVEDNNYMLAFLVKTWLEGKSVEKELLSIHAD